MLARRMGLDRVVRFDAGEDRNHSTAENTRREKEERPARRAPTTHPLPALLGSIRGISRTRKTMRARATALACLVLRCR